jgi:predicted anti-sigma-YlaC factor YlaD
VSKKTFKKTSELNCSCQAAVSLIGEYLSGSSDPMTRSSLDTHLGNCPDCSAFLETYKKTIQATRVYLKLQALQNRQRQLVLRPRNASPAAR